MEEDRPRSTILLWTTSLRLARLIGDLLQASGFRPTRDYEFGTILPGGAFVDGELSEARPLEALHERWTGNRRMYVVGIAAPVRSDRWQGKDPRDAARRTLSAIGVLLPDGMEGEIDHVSLDPTGVSWPPTRA